MYKYCHALKRRTAPGGTGSPLPHCSLSLARVSAESSGVVISWCTSVAVPTEASVLMR